MKIKNVLLMLFIFSVWSIILCGSYCYEGLKKQPLITKGETEVGFRINGKDTIFYIKGDTTKAIKILFDRIDYLQNGTQLMKETYVEPKIFDL